MIEEASQDIALALTQHSGRTLHAGRVDRVIRAIDSLLFELEELNLAGIDRVPPELRRQAAGILHLMPAPGSEEEAEARRVRFRVVPMMDVLFDCEEVLFDLKHPERRDLWDEPA